MQGSRIKISYLGVDSLVHNLIPKLRHTKFNSYQNEHYFHSSGFQKSCIYCKHFTHLFIINDIYIYILMSYSITSHWVTLSLGRAGQLSMWNYIWYTIWADPNYIWSLAILADPPFFLVNNILAGLRLNCISSLEITLLLLTDILLQHRALFQCKGLVEWLQIPYVNRPIVFFSNDLST